MTALTGTETLFVLGQNPTGVPAAQTFQTTTSAIAALAATGVYPVTANTAISTVGAGTLTAAGIVGGLITRTGPVAAFTDTTDTAVAIVAALTAYIASESFYLEIKNTTAFTQTLAAGVGVTMATSLINPPNSVAKYLVTINSPTAVTLLHVRTTSLTNNALEIVTALNTVGAGTITAAGIAGGITTRGGAQSGAAFTDTTATADLIIAAQPNAHVGLSWEYTYKNNTDAEATLAGGTGVTVSAFTVIPANGAVKYLITYTAASTITMAGIQSAGFSADAADSTKQIAFKASGATAAAVLTMASVATADRVLTLPDVTDTVAVLGANTFTAAQTYGALNLRKATNAITAFATGGQASATALTSEINSITVCATAADSVKLPTATAGRIVQVSNLGAAYASIFPASGDLIDALAANASISCAVGGSIRFTCAVTGSWKSTSQEVLGAKFTTGTTTTTFTAGQLTGGTFVNYTNTGATPGSIQTRTAAQMFTDDPYARVGGAYLLRITNGQGTGTLTVTAGSNVTLTGTATIAVNTWRDFVVTYNSATTLTMQNIATGTFS